MAAATSSTGCRVPTSWLADWRATTSACRHRSPATVGRATRPTGPPTRPGRPATSSRAACRTAECSTARVHHPVTGAGAAAQQAEQPAVHGIGAGRGERHLVGRTPRHSATTARALSRISRALRPGRAGAGGRRTPGRGPRGTPPARRGAAARRRPSRGTPRAFVTTRNVATRTVRRPGPLETADWANVRRGLRDRLRGRLVRGSAAPRAHGGSARRTASPVPAGSAESSASRPAHAVAPVRESASRCPSRSTEEGEPILALWQGAWIAALITGVVVWGLIFYAAWRFCRRSDDEIPIQTRYNLPLEIFYTIFPIIMVVVFFSHTVDVQNNVLDDEARRRPRRSRWSASSGRGPSTTRTSPTRVALGLGGRHLRHHPDAGDPGRRDHRVRAPLARRHPRLRGPRLPDEDGRDAGPGQQLPGHAQTETGTFEGKCYELCGVYHSRMLFNVKVVAPEEYDAHLEDLAEAGQHLRGAADRRRLRPRAGRPARPSPRRRRNDRHRRRRPPTAPGRKPLGQQIVRSSPPPTTS